MSLASDTKHKMSDALKIRAGVLSSCLAHPGAAGLVASGGKLLPELAYWCASINTPNFARESVQVRSAAIVRGMATDDFQNVLADAVAGVVFKRYSVNSEHRRLAAFSSVPDFKEKYFPNINQDVDLEEVREGGEFSSDAVLDDGQGLAAKVKTYGKTLVASRELIVNDELDVIFNAAGNGGARAGRLEGRAFYELLDSNPTLDDGESMFHTEHGNLLTPAVFSAASLAVGMAAMRNQEIVAGEKSNHKARLLLVAPDLEADAIQINRVGGFNLEVICGAWLTSGTWYLFAGPEIAPVITLFYLDGRDSGLRVESGKPKCGEGVGIRISYDFGIVPVGRIGVIKGSGL